MNILSATQIREWDRFTIEHEPISSIQLMERAAGRCAEWILAHFSPALPIQIFCGKGNNGGDGLAIARLLYRQKRQVQVYVLESGKEGSADFQANLERLRAEGIETLSFLDANSGMPSLSGKDLIVDALFGSGLNKPLEGLAAELVTHINAIGATVISIDLPSGLFTDRSSRNCPVVKASFTLTFQVYKLALLVQENAPFIGTVEVLDIGLHPDFRPSESGEKEMIRKATLQPFYRPRNRFAHKGTFGHALLAAGSYGKMGAAVLAARACLRSGPGLLTLFIPRCGYSIAQVSVPEAMALTGEAENHLSGLPEDIDRFTAIGIGPGIGTAEDTQKLLSFIVRRFPRPLVIDADALNCFSLRKDLMNGLPAGSLLTPHPKEFDRLFGEHASDFDRIQTALERAAALRVVIVLKGHHTLIATPEGKGWFNNTGNPGMAKGGSGDALTGILTALLSQGYSSVEAALMGVYLHGLAGDLAAKEISLESLTPSDLIRFLSPAFRQLPGS